MFKKAAVLGILVVFAGGLLGVAEGDAGDGSVPWPGTEETLDWWPCEPTQPGCYCQTRCVYICVEWKEELDEVCYWSVRGICFALCFVGGILKPSIGGICAIAGEVGGCDAAARLLCDRSRCLRYQPYCWTWCAMYRPWRIGDDAPGTE